MFVDSVCPTGDSEDLCWFQFLAYLKHLPEYFRIKSGRPMTHAENLARQKTFNGDK